MCKWNPRMISNMMYRFDNWGDIEVSQRPLSNSSLLEQYSLFWGKKVNCAESFWESVSGCGSRYRMWRKGRWNDWCMFTHKWETLGVNFPNRHGDDIGKDSILSVKFFDPIWYDLRFENCTTRIIASVARIQGDLVWQVWGSWTLRDQYESNLGPDWSLGSSHPVPIAFELTCKAIMLVVLEWHFKLWKGYIWTLVAWPVALSSTYFSWGSVEGMKV